MNISGIGVDITKIDRFIELPFFENTDFYNQLFLKSEIDFCIKTKPTYSNFAMIFALKEAVKKSISENIHFLKIEVSIDPILKSLNLLSPIINKYDFLFSTAYNRNLAVAAVISFKKN